MMVDDHNATVDRGVALHKMIRLVTAATINGGYLNFMGNEWGHPEWIDFPREGNGWSHKYARRQWDLVDRKDLKYQFLNNWDMDVMHLLGSVHGFQKLPIRKLWDKDDDQVLAFMRGNLVFVFNFHPFKSFTDYGILAPVGEYEPVIDSDNARYGGYANIDGKVHHFTEADPLYDDVKLAWLKLYIPSRSVQVLRLLPPKKNPTPKKSPAKKTTEKKSTPKSK